MTSDLTAHQLKIVVFVKTCKEPPNRRAVAEHLGISFQAANNLLTKLVKYGCLKAFSQRGASGQVERYFTFVSARRINFDRNHKPKTVDPLYRMFNDPFNLTGASA